MVKLKNVYERMTRKDGGLMRKKQAKDARVNMNPPSNPPPAPVQKAQKRSSGINEEVLREIISEKAPSAVTKSTENRRTMVKNMVMKLRKIHPEITPIQILHYLTKAHIPSSANTYANTMAALFPEMKKFPGWKEHKGKVSLRAKKALPTSNQAKFITLEQMKKFLLASREKMSASHVTIAFMWLTASRRKDLEWAEWIHQSESTLLAGRLSVVLLDLRGSKGDPTGERGDQKATVFPSEWKQELMDILVKKRIPSEYFLKKAASSAIGVQVTLHSCRRGAAATLGRVKINKSEAQQLTLHQQQERKNTRSMDVYQNGMWMTDPRAQNQLKMQLILLMQLGEISNSEMLKADQEVLTLAQYMCQDTPLKMMSQ